MRSVISRRFALLALLALVWLAPACSTPTAPSTQRVTGQRGGALSYRVASPPQTFNYLTASDEPSLIVAFYLMGGRLVEFDHDAQRYVPGLAESWKRADDGKSIELALRDGIKFSNGHPITAEDVVFTLRAIYDERTASPIFRDAMMVGERQIEAFVVDERHLRL